MTARARLFLVRTAMVVIIGLGLAMIAISYLTTRAAVSASAPVVASSDAGHS